jgi:hypothetical protein
MLMHPWFVNVEVGFEPFPARSCRRSRDDSLYIREPAIQRRIVKMFLVVEPAICDLVRKLSVRQIITVQISKLDAAVLLFLGDSCRAFTGFDFLAKEGRHGSALKMF